MDILKMDRNMFLSIVNMKLRDEFSDENDLCSYYGVDVQDFYHKLKTFSLVYDKDNNQIKSL